MCILFYRNLWYIYEKQIVGENMKIIWIDGTFGVGKTAVAKAVVQRIDSACLIEFDALSQKYKPKSICDFFGERYPESKKYLIDALKNEILKLMKDGNYYIVIIPIALINDLCNHELIKDFSDVENYHFILSVSDNILRQRIENQEDRDADLALTYMRTAILYLDSHYPDAIRIDTSDMDVDSVATKIVEIIK